MKKIQLKHERCTGCRLCESVCSLSHGRKMDLTLSRIQVDPSTESSYQLRLCLQCEQCPPVDICPNEAFQWEKKTGVVSILEESCDGCGLCISKCPYSSVFKGNGKVMVCDVCGGTPRCVEVCKKQAILFM